MRILVIGATELLGKEIAGHITGQVVCPAR
jgi:uncharacterized protein YbjT (DUF2867 family)